GKEQVVYECKGCGKLFTSREEAEKHECA
ncbi:MAG: DUF7128 family protein, partial [Nitrososphaeria archaeon]